MLDRNLLIKRLTEKFESVGNRSSAAMQDERQRLHGMQLTVLAKEFTIAFPGEDPYLLKAA
jgi:hypothetical protein